MRNNLGNTAILLLLFTLLVQADVSAQRRNADQLIYTGKFRIYELNQLQGEEIYKIRRNKAGSTTVTAEINLPFMGEEQKPKLNATLRTKADLTPESFQLKGVKPSGLPVDTSITIEQKTAVVIDNSLKEQGSPTSRTRQLPVPQEFFTYGGYMPVTMEMMLIRYWLAHGRENSLPLLPAGEAFVEHRGRDTLVVRGKQVVLDRYHLSGSRWGGGWGRQTLWLDSKERLVAAVNLCGDQETNISAISEGYESSLSFFLKRTVEDGIDRLTLAANRLSPRNTTPLVLLGGTLIDGTGRPPITDSAVVIQADRIVAAGPRSEITIPAGARVINVSGKYLLPGLWDMHAHLYQVELGPAYLAAGITTARDVGNDIEFGTSLRDAAKQGRGLGPRLLLAGYIDGKNDFHSFDVQAGTPTEARAAVRRYKAAGFEQIKIRDHMKHDILKVITAEAHRLGMTVTGHVPIGMNALQAVEAGMDQISHLNYVMTGFFPKEPRNDIQLSIDLNSPESKNVLRTFKEHSTVIDDTLAVIELMIRPMNMPIESFEPGIMSVAPELLEQIEKKGVPAEQAEAVRLARETLLKTIGALHRAGLPIVAGTDVGVPGHTLHRELELYVKAGLTPMEAIQAATLTPARVMKIEKEVGTIEPGKRADILIVEGNPLEDISNIRRTELVVSHGRLFDCAELSKLVGFKSYAGARIPLSNAEIFEIKFSPADVVYRRTLAEDSQLFDCMLQNLVVINRSNVAVALQKIELQLLSKGEVFQSRYIPAQELQRRAQRISSLNQQGALAEAEKEFRLKELFGNATLSSSNTLQPNQGLLIRHQYLQFGGEVDKIRVVAIGNAGDGSAVQSTAEIAVISYQLKTKLNFPLNGTWYVSNGTDVSGTHRWGIGQEFAYDLVKVDQEGNSGKGDETKPQSFYAYGQNVLAPADGVVYETRDEIDDTPISQLADDDPSVVNKKILEYQATLRKRYGVRGTEGNYIIIDHGNNEYSVLVHLKKDSLRVKKGDKVKRGDIIAQVGQSGLSTEPHLHYEVVSNPDPLKQRGLPVVFYNLEDEEGATQLHLGQFVKTATNPH